MRVAGRRTIFKDATVLIVPTIVGSLIQFAIGVAFCLIGIFVPTGYAHYIAFFCCWIILCPATTFVRESTMAFHKATSFFFLAFGGIISALIFAKPELLYKGVILANTGNSVTMNMAFGSLYYTYIVFFASIVPAIVLSLLTQFIKTKSNRRRGGDLVIMLAFGGSSTLVLIFNLILPIFNNWSLIWIGPLALSATIIGFYYTILRYRSLNLVSVWLKIFSYVVLISSIAIIYMIIFALIFTALFRGSMPSVEVIVLNFIMILVFLILMPALSEIMTFIRSLISGPKELQKEDK
jgi:hypothetical protein